LIGLETRQSIVQRSITCVEHHETALR